MLYFILLAIFAYLVGSVNPAYILGKKLKGIDLRAVGSGNPGVSNVFRTLGTGPAIAVAVFDVAKGLLPVLVGRLIGLEVYQYVSIGMAAVVGHSWPMFYGFSGGRGMTTTFGAVYVVVPWPLLIFLATLSAGVPIFKSAGPVMLITFLLLPLWAFLLGAEPAAIIGVFGFIALMLFRRIIGSGYKANRMAEQAHSVRQSLWKTILYRILFDRDTRRRV